MIATITTVNGFIFVALLCDARLCIGAATNLRIFTGNKFVLLWMAGFGGRVYDTIFFTRYFLHSHQSHAYASSRESNEKHKNLANDCFPIAFPLQPARHRCQRVIRLMLWAKCVAEKWTDKFNVILSMCAEVSVWPVAAVAFCQSANTNLKCTLWVSDETRVFNCVVHKVSETSTLRNAPHTKSHMTPSPTLIWLSAFFRHSHRPKTMMNHNDAERCDDIRFFFCCPFHIRISFIFRCIFICQSGKCNGGTVSAAVAFT